MRYLFLFFLVVLPRIPILFAPINKSVTTNTMTTKPRSLVSSLTMMAHTDSPTLMA